MTDPTPDPPPPLIDADRLLSAVAGFVRRLPWLVLFLAVLLPVGLIAYALAAAWQVAAESWRRGREDHARADEVATVIVPMGDE